MKKVTNRQISEVFAAAIDFIRPHTFICTTISYSSGVRATGASDEAKAEAVKIVESRLNGAETLECWLLQQGHIKESEYQYIPIGMAEKMAEFRRAWLRSLAAEYQTKAD